MGNRGDVYERYYMPNFVDKDVLAIFLGTPRRDDLIRAVGRLERHEMAPDGLDKAQQEEIRNDPAVISLTRCRDEIVAQIKSAYPTIKAAKGTQLFGEHGKKNREINKLKAQLIRVKLDKVIDEFHESVHTEEVNRQLQGILPATEVLNPPTFAYELAERAVVARLLFQPLEDLKLDQLFGVRIQLVKALAQLCKRQETPHQFKRSRTSKQVPEITCVRLKVENSPASAPRPSEVTVGNTVIDINPTSGASPHPGTDADLCCPFCKRGPFARPNSLGRHVGNQHLAYAAANEGFPCPYEGCTAFLGGAEHFLNHTACQHGLTLWCAVRR
jgi:hypothetical protein